MRDVGGLHLWSLGVSSNKIRYYTLKGKRVCVNWVELSFLHGGDGVLEGC